MSDPNSPSTKKGSSIMRKLIFSLLSLFLVCLAVCFLATQLTYSEGDRAGTISKFSRKGYVFKTYEGELNVGAQGQVGNMQNNLWEFTVGNGNETSLAKTIEDAMLNGKRVKMHYKQRYLKFSWMGDTEYFITEIEEAK